MGVGVDVGEGHFKEEAEEELGVNSGKVRLLLFASYCSWFRLSL